MRLILYRAIAGSAIAFVIYNWIYPAITANLQQMILLTGVLFLFSLGVETALRPSRLAESTQWAVGYLADIILASMLIYATGGVASPFSFLLGLIIIAAGTHASRMLAMLISLAGCAAYLVAVYSEAWLIRTDLLNTQHALHILLQLSALLLVGGVMAYIARRHAFLHASSDKAVKQHRKLKDLHDKIMHSMREGVIVLDEQLQLSDMNDAARKLLGKNSIAELMCCSELVQFLKQPDGPMFQCECKQKSRVLLVAVTKLSTDSDATWLLTLVDISDIRNLEQQLIQKEKLAAMGQMSAMLAHEIRNPIQTMTQGLEIMVGNKSVGLNIQAIIREEMLRLNRLVSTMLDYSRPLMPSPAVTVMPQLLEAAVNKLEMVVQGHIDWSCELEALDIDGDHFRLVLDNLLSNALANSPEDSTVQLCLGRDENSWCLFICNEGEIPEALRQSLFEPFVTGHAKGFGLGLATVKQVCDVNGWIVRGDSESGQTCFTVTGEIASIAEQDGDKGMVEEMHG